jgi:outer membrane protein OmpA-like peptidoglycan-associated protein
VRRNEVVVRAWGEFRVRRRASGEPELTGDQRSAEDTLVRSLRAGLEWGLPEIVAACGRLDAALGRVERSAELDDASLGTLARRERLMARLECAFRTGFFVVEAIEPTSLREREPIPLEELPLPPPARERPETFFDLRFVDEIGQAIPSLSVLFHVDGDTHEVSTNGAGVAFLDGMTSTSATAEVPDTDALGDLLDQRWQTLRKGSPPKQGKTFETVFDGGDLDTIGVTSVVPHLVVVKPPRGSIVMTLLDKAGRLPHANRPYEITGPVTLSGTTDDAGGLSHADVFPGDYTLTLDVEVEGDPAEHDKYSIPAVVLPPAGAAQVRMVGISADPGLLRLRGLVFDRNKTFVKPGAVEAFKRIRELYERYDPGALLIVGHTDTTGDPATNDPLSLARADSVAAFLEDDVDTWLKNYDQQGKGKWGGREDGLMLRALPDADPDALRADADLGPDPTGNEPPDADLVTWFQRTRGLTVDGIAGPETRKQLITEYMALDGATLSEDDGVDIELTTHGCGENFPLDEEGELDSRPAEERDDESDVHDRRVELFFFDAELGIVPPPPGKNSGPGSTEYPTWVENASLIEDFESDDEVTEAKLIELEDALFRTNSAVLMPEGEAPSADAHTSVTSVGVFAKALRFVEEHAPKKLLIAGHTDTEASAAFNRPLSRERAELTFTLLMGKRARFAELADARHTVADEKQILSWCSVAFPELFACDPGDIDEDPTTSIDAVRDFQSQYNAAKAALAAEDEPELVVDGLFGPATWGAIFDVYDRGLAEELGVDAEGLGELRARVKFLADDVQHVGFGESHPIEEPTRDQFRSQTNRRVELLFFDPGEEPDVDRLRNDPEHSELYDPEIYAPKAVEADFPISDVVFSPLQVFLLDEQRQRMGADPSSPDPTAQVAGAPYRLVLPDGDVRVGYADKDGLMSENDVPDFESCRLDWGAREASTGIDTETSGTHSDDQTSNSELPTTDEEASAFYLYTGTLVVHGSRGKGRVLELLSNLGHLGSEEQRRADFASFYSDSDDATINSVHGTGRPAPKQS